VTQLDPVKIADPVPSLLVTKVRVMLPYQRKPCTDCKSAR